MSVLKELEVEAGPTLGKYEAGRDPIEHFKELRNDALVVFGDSVRELYKDDTKDGHDVLAQSCAAALDFALSGALKEVSDNYLGFTRKAELTEGDGNVYVDLTVRGDLVDCYFAAVNS